MRRNLEGRLRKIEIADARADGFELWIGQGDGMVRTFRVVQSIAKNKMKCQRIIIYLNHLECSKTITQQYNNCEHPSDDNLPRC